MKKMNEEMVNAILGAAILGAMAEQKPEEETPAPTKEVDNALKVRRQYEAFLEVGFTEEQATMFVAAILS